MDEAGILPHRQRRLVDVSALARVANLHKCRVLILPQRVRGMASDSLVLTQSGKRFGRTALVGLFMGLYHGAGIETSSHAGRALFITSLADKGGIAADRAEGGRSQIAVGDEPLLLCAPGRGARR